MSTKNLLVELFVEELPPKALNKLGEAFSSILFESLKSQGLTADGAVVTAFASPRRLALHSTNILSVAPDKTSTQKLMPVSVGLDANGNPTPALIKRLSGMGLDESAVRNLTKQADGKNEALFLDIMQKGVSLTEGLQIALNEAISKLPIPKVMTYQLADGWTSVNFVRPAHGLVAMLGNEVIAVTALGLSAGKETQGHRFEAAVSPVILRDADSYSEQLKTEGAVIASFSERRAEIARQLNDAAAKENLKPIDDEALLDEVTALVERPDDASAVIGGNERVVRPRLADAKFFFDQDRKKTLESRLAGLNKVVYHNKLGSQGARTERVRAIASAIAHVIGETDLVTKTDQAAQLAKTDLVTDMVGEFPELQGIMGRYYAQYEGIDNDVTYAIEDHYKPRFAGDELPRNQVGVVVALADKLETLVGLFSIGEKPSGDKDPFGLRRQALGIIRMLIECKLPLSFSSLIQDVLSKFNIEPSSEAPTIQAVKEFCFDRLSVNLREQGASSQEVDAVLSLNPEILSDIPQRLAAVRTFSALDEAPALAAANKRVGNILKKVEGEVKAEVNTNLLQEPAEIALNEALHIVKPEADKLFESGDYTASLKSLAALKAPVDAFFDNVMVNAEDPALKANRLGLLSTLHHAMNRVADLSKLAS